MNLSTIKRQDLVNALIDLSGVDENYFYNEYEGRPATKNEIIGFLSKKQKAELIRYIK